MTKFYGFFALILLLIITNVAMASQVGDATALTIVQSLTSVGSAVYLKSQGISSESTASGASAPASADPYQAQNQQAQKQAFMEEK